MPLSYQFREKCEKIAAEQRRLVNRAAHEPLSAEALASHHKIMLCEPAGLPGVSEEEATLLARQTDWDGALLPASPNYARVILLRPGVTPARRQATIMHEMAHFLLAHAPLLWNAKSGRFDARRKTDESEAAYLGGCLQIPKVGLVWAAQTGLNVERTARHFGASEQMTIYRANVKRVRLRD